MSINTTVVNGPEWVLVHRVVEAGETLIPVGRRNGVVVDVPADRAAFQERYPHAPFVAPDAAKVFLYRQVQIYITGSYQYNNGTVYPFDGLVGTAYPQDFGLPPRDVPPLTFPDATTLVCCSSTEPLLMWERASFIVPQGDSRVIQQRPGHRHRILLAQGSLTVNGVVHDAPAVIPVKAGDEVSANTRVYAAEVWA